MSDQASGAASSLLSQAVLLRERGGANIVTLPLAAAEAPGAVVAPQPQPPGRDWLSAVELVREASEAIRIAEERNVELEAGLNQVLAEASAEIKELKEQLRSTLSELSQARDATSQAERRTGDAERRANEVERRAAEAERRAEEAEGWLCRLHDAIVKEFGPVARLAPASEPQARSRPAEAIR